MAGKKKDERGRKRKVVLGPHAHTYGVMMQGEGKTHQNGTNARIQQNNFKPLITLNLPIVIYCNEERLLDLTGTKNNRLVSCVKVGTRQVVVTRCQVVNPVSNRYFADAASATVNRDSNGSGVLPDLVLRGGQTDGPKMTANLVTNCFGRAVPLHVVAPALIARNCIRAERETCAQGGCGLCVEQREGLGFVKRVRLQAVERNRYGQFSLLLVNG